MQYQSLLNSISRGVLSPVYLFTGEEDYLQEQAVQALKDCLLDQATAAFNLDELDGDTVTPAQVVECANTLPVFAADKRLVVVKNPVFLSARKKEGEEEPATPAEQRLLDYLKDPALTTCLVFVVAGSADRRKKLVKTIEKTGTVLEFAPLKGEELTSWITRELRAADREIEAKALEFIVLNASHNMRSLKNELEKLVLYSEKEKTITLAMVDQLITKTADANIFALVDSVGLQQPEKALRELAVLLQEGEPPVRILFMIARHIRMIMAAKELSQKGYTEKQITAELAVHPFVTGKILRQGRNFTYSRLEEGLNLLLEGDVALKTGTPARVALENIILTLSAK